ncbi:MAG: hypothetical protein GX754_11845, partial [Clostridiaceae bacterium]|nr:hypothetical protein [Clostridiaceae bacterium]
DLWSVPFRPDRGDIYRNLAENVPDAVLEPIEVFRNDDGKYYKDQYAPVGLYHMSPTTCKHLEAVIKYLNWLATKEPAWTLSWGIESEHYRLVNGAPVPIDVEHNKNTLTYINLDLNLMFAGGDHYPLPPEVSRELIKHTYGELGETAAKAHDTAGKDAIPQLLFDKTLEVQSKYAPELNNTFKEYWVKLIINEDFESTWQEFMKEFKEKGIDEVINERIEYYNTYVKK